VECELAGETEALGEDLPHFTLSTTNPTWSDLGSNQGRRDGKLVTNRLSYGTAFVVQLLGIFIRFALSSGRMIEQDMYESMSYGHGLLKVF
jgi:hypothetical protein